MISDERSETYPVTRPGWYDIIGNADVVVAFVTNTFASTSKFPPISILIGVEPVTPRLTVFDALPVPPILLKLSCPALNVVAAVPNEIRVLCEVLRFGVYTPRTVLLPAVAEVFVMVDVNNVELWET